MARGGFMNDFLFGLAGGLAKGAIDSFGEDTDLGIGLNKGTANKFKEHADDRLETVRKSYFDHIEKLDLAQRQAKDLMSLIGEVDEAGLATNLSASEAAARIMRNKTTTEIDEYIKTFRSQRTDEGLDIRKHYADLFKRGEQEDAIQYTAKDIAKMQVGAFKYKPQQFNLAANRTGLFNLASGFGLFNQTAQEEQEALDKRQRQRITRNLPRFDEVSQPPTRAEARSVINLPGYLMRSAASRRQQTSDELKIDVERMRLSDLRAAAEQRKNNEARKQQEHTATMTNLGLQQTTLGLQQDRARAENYQNQVDLNIGLAKAVANKDYPEARRLQEKIGQNDAIINMNDNISDGVTAAITRNYGTSFTKPYKPNAGYDKGYSPEQKQNIYQQETFKATIIQLNNIKDDAALNSIPDSVFGAVGLSPEDVATAKRFVKINRLARSGSPADAPAQVKLTKGITSYLRSIGEEPTEENIKRVRDQFAETSKYIGKAETSLSGRAQTEIDADAKKQAKEAERIRQEREDAEAARQKRTEREKSTQQLPDPRTLQDQREKELRENKRNILRLRKEEQRLRRQLNIATLALENDRDVARNIDLANQLEEQLKSNAKKLNTLTDKNKNLEELLGKK